jgi:hypothetical protein
MQRHPEEVMHRDDRSMARIEAPERRVDQLAVGQRARVIGHRGRIDRCQLDLDRASSTAPGEIETGVDRQSVQPGLEPLRIAKTRQVAPGADECLLDRVARELRVPKDEAGGRVQPRESDVDEFGKGVMIASLRSCNGVSLVHGRLVRCHDLGGRVRQGMASPSSERFITRTNPDRGPGLVRHRPLASRDDSRRCGSRSKSSP